MFHRLVWIFAVFFLSSIATAQEVTTSGGSVSGKIMSSSTVFAVPIGDVLITPAEDHFVLTTFCASSSQKLVGSTFGYIAEIPGIGGGCLNFSPGVALPKNEVLTCAALSGALSESCQVSGVLSAR